MTKADIALPADPDRRAREGKPPRVVILGGGPGGYEAALTAARTGVETVLIEQRGLGGAAVITDVVPSKTLIATAEVLHQVAGSQELGIRDVDAEYQPPSNTLTVDLAAVNTRVRELAAKQSADIRRTLLDAGVTIIEGRGRLASAHCVEIVDENGEVLDDGTADVILLAVGASPRHLQGSEPDGTRILDWTQLYELTQLPEHLIVVGSGVTGAEFASAYRALGSEVTLVSSRDQVLPGTDTDAADVLETVFAEQGVNVKSRSRAAAARVVGSGADEHVEVELTSGEVIAGSHVLLALGGVPNTADLGLEKVGVQVNERGHIEVDGVSRTSIRGIYAAGDCTGVYPLASVAAMQGRTAMYHALGQAVTPLNPMKVASAIFTNPEIAVVGVSEQQVNDGEYAGLVTTHALPGNPRAKMQGISEGFVKVIVRPGSHTVIGAVVVAPRASELIMPLAMAVSQRLTAEQVASTFTVYPSLTGTIAEGARHFLSAE